MNGPSSLLIVALLALGIASGAALVLQFAQHPARTALSSLFAGLLIGFSSLGAFAATEQVDRREAPNAIEHACKARIKLFC